jgi:hypothetical protein
LTRTAIAGLESSGCSRSPSKENAAIAEGQGMTAAAVERLLSSGHADVIRESVSLVVAELMEAGVAEIVGAEARAGAPQHAAQRLSRAGVEGEEGRR